MKRKRMLALFVVALSLLALLALNIRITYAAPRTTAGYAIDWWTVDGGGGQLLSGAPYTLQGTVGQPDAGAESGGNYDLSGGFWYVDVFGFKLYLPLIMR